MKDGFRRINSLIAKRLKIQSRFVENSRNKFWKNLKDHWQRPIFHLSSHIHNTFCLIGWKALGNWRFFALQRDKVTILLYNLPEKKVVFFRGGVQNVCNFVALWVKRSVVLIYRRYKMRYKNLFLSRCDYEWNYFLLLSPWRKRKNLLMGLTE